MSQPPDFNRFAPPTARVHDVPAAADGELVLADRLPRLGAALVDMILQVTLLWVIGKLTPWNPLDWVRQPTFFETVLNGIGGLVLFLLTHGYLLAHHGQTLGKKFLGLRIVRSNGEAATLQHLAVMRYGIGQAIMVLPYFGIIYGVVDCLSIFRESRQCLHDSLADTIVVKA